MFNITKTDLIQIKEFILICLTSIALSELCSIFISTLYLYHIRCEPLSEIIPIIFSRPFTISCILISLSIISLPKCLRQFSCRITLCFTTALLISNYILGYINTTMLITDSVILRCGAPIIIVSILSLFILLKKYNLFLFNFSIISFGILLRYSLFFLPELFTLLICPIQYFLIEKMFQLLIISVFYFIYYINELEESLDDDNAE